MIFGPNASLRDKPKFDLEDRTLVFSKSIRDLVKELPSNLQNVEYSKQLIRSSASIGANYIEANEALSKKDFLMRLKIAKKEAKETRYWLQLLETQPKQSEVLSLLLQEANEILYILATIIRNAE